MKRYDFVLFAAQSADFVDRLRELGLVDITTTGWEPSESDRQLLLDIEGLAKAIEFARSRREDPAADEAKALPLADGEEAFAVYTRSQREAAALRAEIARLEKTAEELRPWGEFDVDRTAHLAEQGLVLRYFSTQTSTWNAEQAAWSERYTLVEINRSASTVWFVAITAPGAEIDLDAQEMKAPQMDIREAERRIAAEQERLAALQADWARVAASLELLEAHAAALKEQLQGIRVTASAQQAADGTLLIMEGWAEEESSAQVDALLEEYPNVVYLKSDPTPEDDTPVQLRNGWFARIFEIVGDMYARPKYGTIDLTPFFAPFYMLFFGICLNDAGYGLILLGLGLWMLKKNPRPGMMRRAAWFATMCAASTVLFGGFCGSFFGLNLGQYFPSVKFYDFQGKFFSMALAIGVVQILFGMLLNVWVTSRTFGFKYALGTLGWFIIIAGIAIAAGLPILDPALAIPGFETTSPAFFIVEAIGAVLMLMFHTPGRNPLLNIGPGIWNLYNNITGLLSDVLSYIRLFAIGLSGGVLALVFNSLADGFVPDDANLFVRLLIMLPILLVGHGINLFMSTISSFVHPMRLTFVEFYKNAGFEMATRSFDPIRKMKETDK